MRSLSTPCSQATGLAKHATTTYWADGTYRQSAPITLGAIDSGHTWSPEAGAAPVISGAIHITGFTLYSGSIYVANVPVGSYSQDVFTQISGSNVWQRRVRAQADAATLGTFTSNSTGFSDRTRLRLQLVWLRAEKEDLHGEILGALLLESQAVRSHLELPALE